MERELKKLRAEFLKRQEQKFGKIGAQYIGRVIERYSRLEEWKLEHTRLG